MSKRNFILAFTLGIVSSFFILEALKWGGLDFQLTFANILHKVFGDPKGFPGIMAVLTILAICYFSIRRDYKKYVKFE